MSDQRCIGFGEFDNRRKGGPGCSNVADTPARLWCQRCEGLRRAHISARFAEISARFTRGAVATDNKEEHER